MTPTESYSYTNAGFDDFMSRSLDDKHVDQLGHSVTGVGGATLESPSVGVSGGTVISSSKITEGIGNILRLGRIEINGVETKIKIYDTNGNINVLLGEL